MDVDGAPSSIGVVDESRQSSSGLDFKLHPLILINISDHFNRVKANTQGAAQQQAEGFGKRTRVLGCLLGSQQGRVVDISNTFEIVYREGPNGPDIDEQLLATKQEQYKQVFPTLDVVGWYATGTVVEPTDINVHRKIMEVNESPVFVLLDPVINYTRKDLPVYLYETELHVIDGLPQFIFVRSKYTLETSEAERIGVDQVAKILPGGKASGSDQVTAHLSSIHSAIKMLGTRVQLLQRLVEGISKGDVSYDHSLLRQVAALTNSFPVVDSKLFDEEFLVEYNDALLAIVLSSITRGSSLVSDVMDKYAVSYEKPARRSRGMA